MQTDALNLPSLTIVIAELQFDDDRNISHIFIIDALLLAGFDINSYCFDDRRIFIQNFAMPFMLIRIHRLKSQPSAIPSESSYFIEAMKDFSMAKRRIKIAVPPNIFVMLPQQKEKEHSLSA